MSEAEERRRLFEDETGRNFGQHAGEGNFDALNFGLVLFKDRDELFVARITVCEAREDSKNFAQRRPPRLISVTSATLAA